MSTIPSNSVSVSPALAAAAASPAARSGKLAGIEPAPSGT